MSAPLVLACYNIEWFDELFDKRDQLRRGDEWSRRWNVTRAQQADAIAAVLRALDPDACLILEAPNTGARSKRSTVRALSGFASHYTLRQRHVAHGFSSPTDQEIALLYDPDRLRAWHDPLGEKLDDDSAPLVEPAHVPGARGTGDIGARFPGAPRFDGVFPWDVDGDGRIEVTSFSKPPLELGVEHLASGARLRLIGVHLKSKNPGETQSQAERDRIALSARRKHLGQCAWLRSRIEEHLGVGEPVIAFGDFNDSPGLDRYEERLGRSGLEMVVGEGDAALANPYLQQDGGEERAATARFWRSDLDQYLEALLDFILISPDLAARAAPHWRIAHPFNDPEIARQPELQKALLTASDHFPVSVTLNL